VKAEEALFIDDTAEHVDAARALGLRGVVFTTAERLEKDVTDLLDPDHDADFSKSSR